MHVAVGRTTAQVDVVRAREAGFRSYSASPNTILLPDRAYGAYEAVAARLSAASGDADLPLFIPPIGETRAVVQAAATLYSIELDVVRAKRLWPRGLRQPLTPADEVALAGYARGQRRDVRQEIDIRFE